MHPIKGIVPYHMQTADNNKEITIRDLARQLALSPATVSRALNNYGNVTKPTKRRVLEMAEKMGYQTNDFARILKRRHSNTIGFIVPELDSYIMATVVAGMEKVASREGYNLIVMQSHGSITTEATCAHVLFNKRVDGLVVALSQETPQLDHFKPFVDKQIPIVSFDADRNSQDFVNLFIDNRKAGYAITRHLIEQGCKRIVHLTARIASPVYKERYEGYRLAMEEFNLPINKQYIIKCDMDIQAGSAVVETILGWEQKPDAILAAGDQCAVGCIMALRSKGIRIPEDIAVAGFGNDLVSMVVEPGLTTMSYPGYQMGESAINHLVQHLQGAISGSVINNIILRSDLVVRDSTRLRDAIPVMEYQKQAV